MKEAQASIYLDQAATSWPKPKATIEAMVEALHVSGSPSRSAHAGARKAERLLSNARKTVADFFTVGDSNNLVFVPGATYGLNMVLRAACEHSFRGNTKGDKLCVAYSGGEHNAVTRTLAEGVQRLNEIKGQDTLSLTEIPLKPNGQVCLARIEGTLKSARPITFVCQHASNVTGIINPIEQIAQICLQLGVDFIVDGSQAAGHLSVQLDRLAQTGVSAWVSSGHKGLMGPAGSGLVYLAESFKLRPFITGGTGGGSHIIDLSSPRRPIDYEVGTPALSAIMGLAAGISEIGKSFDGDIKRVDTLTSFVFDGLSDIQNVRVLGPLDLNTPRRLPLASIVVDDIPSNELAFLLENQYGIATRAGLHCAPLTHKYLGTYPDGALRLSWNVSNTIKDIERALTAIKEIAKNNG